eukprot:CAMPEP_0117425366 /NCGR_PEP_ID=MMETSP0758-20121206/5633_1 /TAXON_ID=63605 /ORGANISM="Percolomonas cosmopolitus, Strain AE-1 (ATCC 50343)" /LENGTH=166 /DNA_ID=CAMNT_0005209769 /DNA_START=33 /DNA_END=529 /DNA_ORIENTATION=-
MTDIWRDTAIRYLGYTNELGEAFRPMIPKSWVIGTYVISTGYALGDTADKAKKEWDRTKSSKKTLREGLNTCIWQLAASVIIPGYCVHTIVALSKKGLRNFKKGPIRKWGPTVLGLSSIPFFPHLIDPVVDYGMENLDHYVLKPMLVDDVFEDSDNLIGGESSKET